MSRKSGSFSEYFRVLTEVCWLMAQISTADIEIAHDLRNLEPLQIGREVVVKSGDYAANQLKQEASEAQRTHEEANARAMEGSLEAAELLMEPPHQSPPPAGGPSAANDNNPWPANDNNPNGPPTSSAGQSPAETAAPPANAIGFVVELDNAPSAASQSSPDGGASANGASTEAQASDAGSLPSEAGDGQVSAPEAANDNTPEAANDNSSSDSSADADTG
jgi:hypothetical protein